MTMKVIHRSKIEYTEYVSNPGYGCPGGCLYCWAMKQSLRFKLKKDYQTWLIPTFKEKYLEKLETELSRIPKGSEIWYGNTLDAFSPSYREITKHALRIFSKFPITVRLLSKYHAIASDEFLAIYTQQQTAKKQHTHTKFLPGVSLTTLDPAVKRQFEPYTSTPQARLKAIEKFTQHKVKFWISLEPVLPGIDPIEIIKGYIENPYCVQIVVGKLNYYEREFYSDAEYLRWYEEAQRINAIRNFIHVKKEHINYLIRKGLLTKQETSKAK